MMPLQVGASVTVSVVVVVMRVRYVEYRHACTCVYYRDVYCGVFLFVFIAIYDIFAPAGDIRTFWAI